MATATANTYDGQGNLIDSRQITIPDSDVNRETIQQQAIAAIATLESNYTNWASLTNAQKDTANRLAQRVCAKTIRYLLNQVDSAGP